MAGALSHRLWFSIKQLLMMSKEIQCCMAVRIVLIPQYRDLAS